MISSPLIQKYIIMRYILHKEYDNLEVLGLKLFNTKTVYTFYTLVL